MGDAEGPGSGGGFGDRAIVLVCVHQGCVSVGDEAVVADTVGEDVEGHRLIYGHVHVPLRVPGSSPSARS